MSAGVCGIRRVFGRSRFVCIHSRDHQLGRHVFVRDRGRRLQVVR